MRAPTDDVTNFWSLVSERTSLKASVLAWRSTAPMLPLANFLYAVQPSTPLDLERDLDRAAERLLHPRTVIEPDTPPWVEAELVLRGWRPETEFRLVLESGTQFGGTPGLSDVRRADDVDADWSARAAMFRIDHLEEDARLGNRPRPPAETEVVIEHRRELERYATYFCAHSGDEATGFICTWRTQEGRGVIEDVFVHPDHRGQGLATAMISQAVTELRASGAGHITIAAEVGDTPVQLYARLGFRPSSITRTYTKP